MQCMIVTQRTSSRGYRRVFHTHLCDGADFALAGINIVLTFESKNFYIVSRSEPVRSILCSARNNLLHIFEKRAACAF